MDTANYIIAEFTNNEILVEVPDPADPKIDQPQLIKQETRKNLHGAIIAIEFYLYSEIKRRWEKIYNIGIVDKSIDGSKRVHLNDVSKRQDKIIIPNWAGPSRIFYTPKYDKTQL